MDKLALFLISIIIFHIFFQTISNNLMLAKRIQLFCLCHQQQWHKTCNVSASIFRSGELNWLHFCVVTLTEPNASKWCDWHYWDVPTQLILSRAQWMLEQRKHALLWNKSRARASCNLPTTQIARREEYNIISVLRNWTWTLFGVCCGCKSSYTMGSFGDHLKKPPAAKGQPAL